VIDTDDKLAEFLPQLSVAGWIALDTEADSLHAYPEKLCLMQISLDGGDWLLDPLSRMNLTPVFGLLGQHEMILHGADYDLRLLRKYCGFVPSAIFDTMIASRLLGCREFGLGNLVQKYLGVTLEKGPQKANWARRPLTPRMEAYARHDTHYLKPLADILAAGLKATGRTDWHRQSCAALIADCAEVRLPDPDTVWRLKGSSHLNPTGLAVLRELWRWREEEAVASGRPPFFILPHETLVFLAGAAAAGDDYMELLPRFLTARRREGVRRAVVLGLAVKNLPQPLRTKGHRMTEPEKRRLNDLERRRNRHAGELGIDPTLIASRAALVALARHWENHQADLLPWQRGILAG
jgi:ribonuclease D